MTDYKIVTLSYTEQASLVIKAKDNDEAEEVIWDEFSNVPDLQILSIEECPEDVVADLKQQNEAQQELNLEPKVLN